MIINRAGKSAQVSHRSTIETLKESNAHLNVNAIILPQSSSRTIIFPPGST
jgi:hypothetical protein